MEEWTYIPEMPPVGEEVLVAIRGNDVPVQAYWDGVVWKVSYEVRDSMLDYPQGDSTLHSPEFIYAWKRLPKMPEYKESN